MHNKYCTGCKEIKPSDAFGVDVYTKDGYRSRCKLCRSLIELRYRNKNRVRIRKQDKLRWKAEKVRTLTHYGGGTLACVICGESRIDCLSLDHIAGGGARQRKELKVPRFYKWLENRGFPIGYQTLCMNCQWVKRFEEKEAKENAR